MSRIHWIRKKSGDSSLSWLVARGSLCVACCVLTLISFSSSADPARNAPIEWPLRLELSPQVASHPTTGNLQYSTVAGVRREQVDLGAGLLHACPLALSSDDSGTKRAIPSEEAPRYTAVAVVLELRAESAEASRQSEQRDRADGS
jgi:hypothetical protein